MNFIFIVPKLCVLLSPVIGCLPSARIYLINKQFYHIIYYDKYKQVNKICRYLDLFHQHLFSEEKKIANTVLNDDAISYLY